jgi:DNA-binding transcriptional LysR family regulator
MRLRELEIFRAIMVGGSISEAARILNVSQPAISTALRHAEDRMGVVLFHRERGRIIPTPEALKLYAEVESLFKKLSAIRKLAEGLRDTGSGIISIASTPTLTYAFLSKAIARFRIARPGVRVLLEVTHTQHTVELAAAGQINLGFIHAPLENPAVQSEKLATSEMICVLPKDHELAGRAWLGPKDLCRYPIITNMRNSIASRVEEAFREVSIERDFAIACNHTMTVFMMVEAGAGIGLVDPWVRREMFPSLLRKPFRPRITLSPRAIFQRSQPLSPLAREFLEAVREQAVRSDDTVAVSGTSRPSSCR